MVRYHDPEDLTLSYDFWENLLGQVYEATQAPPRSFRRFAKEPFWVKSLRTRFNSELNEASRVAVGQTLLKALKITKLQRDLAQVALNASQGRRVWASRKSLLPILGFCVNQVKIFDVDRCNTLVAEEYRERWGLPDLERQEDTAWLRTLGFFNHYDDPIVPSLLEDALDDIKAPRKIDSDFACTAMIKVSGWSQRLKGCIQACLGNPEFWNNVTLGGHLGNKIKGFGTPAQTRVVIPQPAIAKIGHAYVARAIIPVLDSYTDSKGLKGLIFGLSKGGQLQELHTSVYHILEYGRDHFNKGMVGITDIKAHHDQIRYGLVLRSLLGRGVPFFLAVGCIRLHRNPQVSISLMDSNTGVIQRDRGLMQGAGTACILARVSVEDCFAATLEKISHSSLGIAIRCEQLRLDFRIALLSWSDNIFVVASSEQDLATLTALVESELWNEHRLRLKEDREILPAYPYHFQGYKWSDSFGKTWSVVPEAKVLGPVLTANGSCHEDVKRGISQINKAFWANSKFLINSHIPMSKRLAKLNCMAGGIIRSRGAAWVPCKTTADLITKAQNQCIRIMLKLKRLPGESPEQYNLRRNRKIKGFKEVSWAIFHLDSAISWVSHMQRHPEDFSSRLFQYCKHWVSQNRYFDRSGGSRTHSRSHRGFVFRYDKDAWTTLFSPQGSKDKKYRLSLAKEMFDWIRQPLHLRPQ